MSDSVVNDSTLDQAVKDLIICPAGDVNYRYCLEKATLEQLCVAGSVMRLRNLAGTKERQAKIAREIKRRVRIAQRLEDPAYKQDLRFR